MVDSGGGGIAVERQSHKPVECLRGERALDGKILLAQRLVEPIDSLALTNKIASPFGDTEQ